MGSGLAAARRPGMTKLSVQAPSMAEGFSDRFATGDAGAAAGAMALSRRMKPLFVSDKSLARQIDAFCRVIDDLADYPCFPVMFFKNG